MAVIPKNIIEEIEVKIDSGFEKHLLSADNEQMELELLEMIQKLHDSIDDKKRISYGITYVIKTLAKMFYQRVDNPYELGMHIYEDTNDFKGRCLGLGILSYVGVQKPDVILPILADAASKEHWTTKEFVQMYVRKITKKHPNKVQNFLIEMAKSDDPNKRRFASESLRPVAENRWIQDSPEFSLKVLRLLFKESESFPRISVGNNLSDLSRKNPELIFSIVKELMDLKDENAALIAHRACRNLVINDPIRVMDLLNCDEYKYKNRHYKREDLK